MKELSGNNLNDSNHQQGGHANLQQGNKQRRGLAADKSGNSGQRQK